MQFNINGSNTIIGLAILCLVCGCSDKSEVPAVSRNSKFEPNFEVASSSASTNQTEKKQLVGPLKYLNRDHFGCLKISLGKLKATPELDQVPWQDLESSLQEIVGKDAPVEQIAALYVVLDSQFLKFEDFNACVGVLFEFSPDAQYKLPEQSLNERSDTENQSPVRTLLEPNLLAYGPANLVEKLNANNSNVSAIASTLVGMDSSYSVTGAATLRPIRSALKGIFSLFAMQPELQAYSELPNDIQEFSFALDIADEKDFFEFKMAISNPELKKKIVQSLNQLMADRAQLPETPSQLPGVPESMFESESTGVMLSVINEVVEDGLLTVSDEKQTIKLNLARPQELQNLVTSAIGDYAKQVNLVNRLKGAEMLAKALEKYYQEHGVLPPLGPVQPGGKLPAQSNWRTGLLPHLGYDQQHEQFDFSLPWNDASNLEIAESLLAETADRELGFPLLSFDLVAGPERMYEELEKAPTLDRISDRKIWTAIAVERAQPIKNWTESPNQLTPTSRDQLGMAEELGIIAINGSFGTRILKRSSEKTDEFFTVSGGEKFSRSDFLKLPESD